MVYYYDQNTRAILRTEVPFTTSDPGTPQTLQDYSGQPLTDFVGSGNPTIVAKRVHECTWEIENPAFLVFEFRTEKKRYQAQDNESKTLASRVFLRN